MNPGFVASQLFQTLLAVFLAPLMLGWVNQSRAWLQNKSGPGWVQPYRVLLKLFQKDAVLAHSIVPVLATDLPYAPAADIIALVGLFALARVFMALAGMDVGTAFG